ncbi:GIY-YIG nuclease family protein [Candidatus Uhrbacteria bacterium]|nr:GIY-YIG nuclease family protein [Candidatus Uhrbacteria bacterium]
MSYATYIIFSQAYSRYYIGSTKDIGKRLKKHNSGATKSTKPYRPWVLIYLEKFQTKSEAYIREKELKSYKGGEAFKRLLRSNPASGGTPPSSNILN